MWHSVLIDFGCVTSRILLIKFKFSRVKVCVVVGYSPSEDVEERDIFCNDMDWILGRVGNGYRLCIMGDRMKIVITGAFRVP